MQSPKSLGMLLSKYRTTLSSSDASPRIAANHDPTASVGSQTTFVEARSGFCSSLGNVVPPRSPSGPLLAPLPCSTSASVGPERSCSHPAASILQRSFPPSDTQLQEAARCLSAWAEQEQAGTFLSLHNSGIVSLDSLMDTGSAYLSVGGRLQNAPRPQASAITSGVLSPQPLRWPLVPVPSGPPSPSPLLARPDLSSFAHPQAAAVAAEGAMGSMQLSSTAATLQASQRCESAPAPRPTNRGGAWTADASNWPTPAYVEQHRLQQASPSSSTLSTDHHPQLLGHSVLELVQQGADAHLLQPDTLQQDMLQESTSAPPVLVHIPAAVHCINLTDLRVVRDARGREWELGRGTFGKVYRAQYHGQDVAVKVLPGSAAIGSQELELLQQCRHQHVVQFLGANVVYGHLVLVFELMEGGDLFHRLKGPHALEWKWQRRGRHVAIDIARGLEYLHHHRQMVHGDLKSPNVLLTRHGRAKLADLGLARPLLGSYASIKGGSLAWAGPELLCGKIGTAYDIYSFSVVLWELVTGERPRRSEMRPFRVPEECSQAVADLYSRCSQVDPKDRPSASELVAMLQQLQQ